MLKKEKKNTKFATLFQENFDGSYHFTCSCKAFSFNYVLLECFCLMFSFCNSAFVFILIYIPSTSVWIWILASLLYICVICLFNADLLVTFSPLCIFVFIDRCLAPSPCSYSCLMVRPCQWQYLPLLPAQVFIFQLQSLWVSR